MRGHHSRIRITHRTASFFFPVLFVVVRREPVTVHTGEFDLKCAPTLFEVDVVFCFVYRKLFELGNRARFIGSVNCNTTRIRGPRVVVRPLSLFIRSSEYPFYDSRRTERERKCNFSVSFVPFSLVDRFTLFTADTNELYDDRFFAVEIYSRESF